MLPSLATEGFPYVPYNSTLREFSLYGDCDGWLLCDGLLGLCPIKRLLSMYPRWLYSSSRTRFKAERSLANYGVTACSRLFTLVCIDCLGAAVWARHAGTLGAAYACGDIRALLYSRCCIWDSSYRWLRV